MADISVVTAVEAHVQAGFNRCRVLVGNEEMDVPPAPWLLIDFPWSRSEWVEADRKQEEGAFRAILALDRNVGEHEGRRWLGEVASLFECRDVGGVQFFTAQSPTSDDRNDAGGQWRLEITVPYRTLIEV